MTLSQPHQLFITFSVIDSTILLFFRFLVLNAQFKTLHIIIKNDNCSVPILNWYSTAGWCICNKIASHAEEPGSNPVSLSSAHWYTSYLTGLTSIQSVLSSAIRHGVTCGLRKGDN